MRVKRSEGNKCIFCIALEKTGEDIRKYRMRVCSLRSWDTKFEPVTSHIAMETIFKEHPTSPGLQVLFRGNHHGPSCWFIGI